MAKLDHLNKKQKYLFIIKRYILTRCECHESPPETVDESPLNGRRILFGEKD